MADALRLTLAFFVAGGAALLLTPLAIRLAERTSFYDHPVGYKGHRRATPYLGGVAVVSSVILASALLANAASAFAPIAVGAVALLVLGTVDDRHGLGPLPRILFEMCAAAGLYAAGVGWSIFTSNALNLVMTIVFVIGVVNAYNLMDNMDGATGSVAAATGAVLGVLATGEGDAELGAICFALCGACLGFLRFNLASPSRIFLGDGGSMPIGFVVAAAIMELGGSSHLGWALIPVAVALVGLPALDTSLVIVSRLRRGVGVLTGGRDHLSHRLLSRLGSPRRVASVLVVSQGAICGVGAVLFQLGRRPAAIGALAMIAAGIALVAWLESPGWASTTSESSA